MIYHKKINLALFKENKLNKVKKKFQKTLIVIYLYYKNKQNYQCKKKLKLVIEN